MNKRLKDILLAIAKCPSADQRWILRQLPPMLHARFEQYDGSKQLQMAQRFRTFNIQINATPISPLPNECASLSTRAPLYIAIILEQGLFSWTNSFLKQYDKGGKIQSLLEDQVTHIKPLVKIALFHEWKNPIAFETFLEDSHGASA